MDSQRCNFVRRGFGDFVSKTLTWNGGVAAVPVPKGTEGVAVQVAMRGAKLYSLELVCAEH